jgi:hypothetical protein
MRRFEDLLLEVAGGAQAPAAVPPRVETVAGEVRSA